MGTAIAHHQLALGRITHGYQYVDEESSGRVTTYYGPPTGVGLAVQYFPLDTNATGLRVGVVGLGVGTLAGYAEAGDRYRMYEINQQVVDLNMCLKQKMEKMKDEQGRELAHKQTVIDT